MLMYDHTIYFLVTFSFAGWNISLEILFCSHQKGNSCSTWRGNFFERMIYRPETQSQKTLL